MLRNHRHAQFTVRKDLGAASQRGKCKSRKPLTRPPLNRTELQASLQNRGSCKDESMQGFRSNEHSANATGSTSRTGRKTQNPSSQCAVKCPSTQGTTSTDTAACGVEKCISEPATCTLSDCDTIPQKRQVLGPDCVARCVARRNIGTKHFLQDGRCQPSKGKHVSRTNKMAAKNG